MARHDAQLQILQSAAVFGNLLAIAVQKANKTDPELVQFQARR